MTTSSKPPASVPVASSTLAKLALLSSLYFSQGLPYGFFTQALPVWMRQAGMDLSLIGFSSILALPWGLKMLWAPLVDRFDGSPLGRRRGWILPLQGLTTMAIVALAFVGEGNDAHRGTPVIAAMAVAMFVTNLFAATQDIATDGFAIDLLSSSDRGLGNGVQVAAYRVGMIVGGGALLFALSQFGWTPTFLLMALLIAVMTLPIALHREAPRATTTKTTVTELTERASWSAALQFLARKRGQMVIWCLGIGLYKIGDAFGSPMARTMLVDQGYSIEDIALLLGTLGSLAGMAGALLGGLMARRGRLLALVVCGLVHAALMAAYGFAVVWQLDASVVGTLVVLEHITGGMATVALFTAMMDACEPKTGATDYTVQASIVVFASGIGSALSGVSAQAVGYGIHFGAAGVVCVVGTLAMMPLYRLKIAPRDPAFDDELANLSLPRGAVSSTGSTAVSATTSEHR